MAAGRHSEEEAILASTVRVPEHVVYRDFPEETVMLNLDSGQYHGLNATAAKMVTTLESATTVAAAVDALAADFGQPRELIERDVVTLCRALDERGLIERDDAHRAA
jgi:hypothetical protein